MSPLYTRRQIVTAPMLASCLARGAGGRMNVQLIAVDDLNNRIGCYGDKVVKTPNIDRLAARGVRFDRAYCNYPVCNASRTSLLSGRRPETTRVLGNQIPPRTHLGNIRFLPEYFHDHGYFTARRGKIAHGAFEDAVTWDVSESARGRPAAARTESADPPPQREGAREGGSDLTWTATKNSDAEEPDGRTARRIAQLMAQKRDKPFFMGAGFHKPHLPWVAPKKYFDLYDPMRIELPATPADDRNDIPAIALTRNPNDEKMTDDQRRQAIAAYHACTSFTDAQIGVLLDQMDTQKLWDNTVVLLFGDHGWHLNEHLGLWRKMTVFEESARAPLIVAAPGFKPGTASRGLVEFVDIFPTLAELCHLPKPDGMEGLSLTPLLKDPAKPWKKAAFTLVSRGRNTLGRSVRTERYRYTEWNGPEVAELYDHVRDPNEWANLAKDPAQEKVLAEMRRYLREGWRAALPG